MKLSENNIMLFDKVFVLQAWKLWNENNIVKLIDPKIFDSSFAKEVVRCVHIGLLCVQEYAEDRPNVSQFCQCSLVISLNYLLLNNLHLQEDMLHHSKDLLKTKVP